MRGSGAAVLEANRAAETNLDKRSSRNPGFRDSGKSSLEQTNEINTTTSDVQSGVTETIVEDRRITRSKRALRQALIELMAERGLGSFTVAELCARADLNRGTFYNHFHSIDGILALCEEEVIAGFDEFKDEVRRLSLGDLIKSRIAKKPFPCLVKLFDYLRQQADFLQAVLGSGGDSSFAPRIKDAICTDLICRILHQRYLENPTPFVEYYIEFYSTAYLGVIRHWMETGMRESSEEMGLIVIRLLFIQPGEPLEL